MREKSSKIERVDEETDKPDVNSSEEWVCLTISYLREEEELIKNEYKFKIKEKKGRNLEGCGE